MTTYNPSLLNTSQQVAKIISMSWKDEPRAYNTKKCESIYMQNILYKSKHDRSSYTHSGKQTPELCSSRYGQVVVVGVCFDQCLNGSTRKTKFASFDGDFGKQAIHTLFFLFFNVFTTCVREDNSHVVVWIREKEQGNYDVVQLLTPTEEKLCQLYNYLI